MAGEVETAAGPSLDVAAGYILAYRLFDVAHES
jgi:hypothetical protein